MSYVFEQFKVGAPPAMQNPKDVVNQQVLQPVPQPIREPRVSLPKRFDGIRSKFQGFVN